MTQFVFILLIITSSNWNITRGVFLCLNNRLLNHHSDKTSKRLTGCRVIQPRLYLGYDWFGSLFTLTPLEGGPSPLSN